MFKKIVATVSAVAFVMLAVALAPGVPTVLATVRATTTNDDTKLNQPVRCSGLLSVTGAPLRFCC
jgi:hypothetical protein